MDVKEIFDKFGEMCFRLALAHLFDKGTSFFKNANIDDMTFEIERSASDNSIISKEMQVQINRCACELSKNELWDILKFVKTKLDMPGVTIHEGKLVSFRENCSGEEKAWFTVSSDTDIEQIRTVEAMLEEKTTQYEEENGDFSDFDYEATIYECLKSAEVNFKYTEPDFIVYI